MSWINVDEEQARKGAHINYWLLLTQCALLLYAALIGLAEIAAALEDRPTYASEQLAPGVEERAAALGALICAGLLFTRRAFAPIAVVAIGWSLLIALAVLQGLMLMRWAQDLRNPAAAAPADGLALMLAVLGWGARWALLTALMAMASAMLLFGRRANLRYRRRVWIEPEPPKAQKTPRKRARRKLAEKPAPKATEAKAPDSKAQDTKAQQTKARDAKTPDVKAQDPGAPDAAKA